jgi:hypothetical protein
MKHEKNWMEGKSCNNPTLNVFLDQMNDLPNVINTIPFFGLLAASCMIATLDAHSQGINVEANVSANDKNTVVLAGSNQTFDRQANGQDFVLGGSNDKFIIHGECGSVSVTGSNNLVTLDKVRQINVVGTNNAFTYRESAGVGTPQFASIGTNNTVQKAESERPSSGLGKLESTSPEAAKAGGTLVIEGSGGQNRSETVSDADVVVNSGGNHLTFSGSVKTLTVNGGGNQIALEKVESITFNGSGNSAAYSVEKSGGKAKVTDNGHGNSVSDTE